MNEREVRIRLQSIIYTYCNALSWRPDTARQDDVETPIVKVESYGQKRITTASEGFLVTLTDGSEYQVTVCQSKLHDSEK